MVIITEIAIENIRWNPVLGIHVGEEASNLLN